MKDLIKALTIISKYDDAPHTTRCEEGVLYVGYYVDIRKVFEDDLEELAELGFIWNHRLHCFESTYGNNLVK